ncbi:MAG: hypothetical protein AB4290_22855 [Spirulina sp.]
MSHFSYQLSIINGVRSGFQSLFDIITKICGVRCDRMGCLENCDR